MAEDDGGEVHAAMDWSESQAAAIDAVLHRGRNVFITGAAGSGKTAVVQHIHAELTARGRHVAVTATTGIAAVAVGGRTLHSFMGFSVDAAQKTVEELQAAASGKAWFCKAMRELEILFIDEVSMLSPAIFVRVDAVLRCVRQSARPFGGVRLVLTGDFAQLPPTPERHGVAGPPLASVGAWIDGAWCREGAPSPRFIFELPLWYEAVDDVFNLTTVWRQADAQFVELLGRARVGALTDADMAVLATRELPPDADGTGGGGDGANAGLQPTILYTHTVDVDALNTAALARIDGPTVSYPIRSGVLGQGRTKGGGDAAQEALLARLRRDVGVPDALQLKVGAQVMASFNLSAEDGIMNGSRGVVVGFQTAARTRAVADTESYFTAPGGTLGYPPRVPLPIVAMRDRSGTLRKYEVPYVRYGRKEAGVGEAYVWALALRHAAATTIHRCVTGDTLIPVRDCGLMRIDEMEPLWHGTGRDAVGPVHVHGASGTRRVLAVVKAAVEPAMRIVTGRGFMMTGSLRHPLLVLGADGSLVWRPLGQLTRADVVVVACNTGAAPPCRVPMSPSSVSSAESAHRLADSGGGGETETETEPDTDDEEEADKWSADNKNGNCSCDDSTVGLFTCSHAYTAGMAAVAAYVTVDGGVHVYNVEYLAAMNCATRLHDDYGVQFSARTNRAAMPSHMLVSQRLIGNHKSCLGWHFRGTASPCVWRKLRRLGVPLRPPHARRDAPWLQVAVPPLDVLLSCVQRQHAYLQGVTDMTGVIDLPRRCISLALPHMLFAQQIHCMLANAGVPAMLCRLPWGQLRGSGVADVAIAAYAPPFERVVGCSNPHLRKGLAAAMVAAMADRVAATAAVMRDRQATRERDGDAQHAANLGTAAAAADKAARSALEAVHTLATAAEMHHSSGAVAMPPNTADADAAPDAPWQPPLELSMVVTVPPRRLAAVPPHVAAYMEAHGLQWDSVAALDALPPKQMYDMEVEPPSPSDEASPPFADAHDYVTNGLVSHNSQGLSLDLAVLHLGDVFEDGQAYVAMSRLRSLEGMQLRGLRPDTVRADPRVVAFYARPYSAARDAARALARGSGSSGGSGGSGGSRKRPREGGAGAHT